MFVWAQGLWFMLLSPVDFGPVGDEHRGGNITASWQQEARVPVSPSTGCLGSFLLLNPSHHRPYHLLLYHQRPTEDTEDLSHNRRHVYKSVDSTDQVGLRV